MQQEKIRTSLQRSRYVPSWMVSRTCLCKHKLSCCENVINGFVSTFGYCFVGKLILSNMRYLFSPAKLAKNLLSWKSGVDSFRIALFVGLVNGVYKLVLCIMRRLTRSNKISSIVAGFVAGLCIRFDAKSRRVLTMLLVMSRVVDAS